MPFTMGQPNTTGHSYFDEVSDDLITRLQRQQALAAKMIDERDERIKWLQAEIDRLRAPSYEAWRS